jgi:hypothetical protein
MAFAAKDESNLTAVWGADGSGSWEFGSATPSTTGGTVTVDGVTLNTTSGFFLANSLAASSSLNRTTGTVTMPNGAGSTVNVDTSSKSDYTVITWELQNATFYVNSLGTTIDQLVNVSANGGPVNYSWL